MLVLLNRKNQLLYDIFEELVVFSPCLLGLFDSRINGEEPCLIQLLRLYQGRNPVFLSFLQILDDLLLVDQVFLILAEVLRANIFDLIEFFIILLLQVLSVRVRSRGGLCHESLHILAFVQYVILQFLNLFSQSLGGSRTILSLYASDLKDLL